MVNIDQILQRADDETLQILIGRNAVRLLSTIDPTLVRPSKLREVLINITDRIELLRNSETREELISLLRQNEARALADLLTFDPKDPYKALKRVSFRKNSNDEEILFDFFEVDKPQNTEIEFKETESFINPTYSLFKHQRVAAEKIKGTVFQGVRRRVLLHMPTGSGKTRTTMNIISDFLRNNEPALIIWLAYSEELCEQAASEFETCWSFLGNRGINVHRFWGNHDINVDEITDGIIISSLAKMYYTTNKGLYRIGQLGSKANLIIFDEAHQAIAPTFKYVLNALLQHSAESALIGLSATPGRTWNDIGVDLELSEFFYKQKVTLQVEGYNNPVEYLIEEGYLAKASYKKLFVNSDLTFSPKELSNLQEELEIPNSILKKLAEDEKRNLSIITRLKKLINNHSRVLFFATNVEHSELIARVLQATGISAYSITSNTTYSNRKKWISRFKKQTNDPMILCNYGVLTTGFDAPRTSAALISRPTKSLVLYSQMVGRAIRGPKAGGNKNAEIWTVVDSNLPGFGSVSEAFANWEDVWENQ